MAVEANVNLDARANGWRKVMKLAGNASTSPTHFLALMFGRYFLARATNGAPGSPAVEVFQ